MWSLLLIPVEEDEDFSCDSTGVAGFNIDATATAILCTSATDRGTPETPPPVADVDEVESLSATGAGSTGTSSGLSVIVRSSVRGGL